MNAINKECNAGRTEAHGRSKKQQGQLAKARCMQQQYEKEAGQPTVCNVKQKMEVTQTISVLQTCVATNEHALQTNRQ